MTELPAYQFEGYTFRAAMKRDLRTAQSWNAFDPDHTWEARRPLYWIEQSPRVNSYVLEDAAGIVFFVKSIRQPHAEIEISLQFDRKRDLVSEIRVMRAMLVGFTWLKKALPANAFDAVYFKSKNPQLAAFAQRGLGFVLDGDRYLYVLTPKETCDGRQVDTEGRRKNEEQRHPGQVWQSHR